MRNADKYDCKGKKLQFMLVPVLFCYQEDKSQAKEAQGHEPVMMFFISMDQGDGSNAEGNKDHHELEGAVMNDINSKDGETDHHQRQNSTMDGTGQGA